MSKHPAVLLAGLAAAAFVVAVPAAAQPAPTGGDWHTTTVALPDGSKAEIRYVGDVPPQVTVLMPAPRSREIVDSEEAADLAYGYGDIPRARRVIQPRPAPDLPQAALPQLVVSGDAPRGSTYEYTLISTGIDGKVCAQRTEWTSRGPGKEPHVRRDDTGEGCTGAKPAPSVAPQAAPVHPPVRIDPDAI